MKRLLALMLTVCLLLACAGCTPAQKDEAQPPSDGSQTPPGSVQTPDPAPDGAEADAPDDEKEDSAPDAPAEGEEAGGSAEDPDGQAPGGDLPPDSEQPAKPEVDRPSSSDAHTPPSSGNGGTAQKPGPDSGASQKPTGPGPGSESPSVVQPDSKGMMDLDGNYVQAPEPLDSRSVERFAQKLQAVRDAYLASSANVYYSMIPDKSYYAKERVQAYLDHDAIMEQLRPLLPGWTEIDIADLLTLDSFLKTDNHWKQECILPVAQRIAQELGFDVNAGEFTQHSRDGFVGSYGSFVEAIAPESISWMQSQWTDEAICDNFQYPDRTKVYDESLVDTISAYDLFLGGQTPLVTVTVPNSGSDRHLIVFRDSFGASLAPLLLSGYGKVTLVDLRYMAADLLPQFVNADGADVLFLFCDRVANNSNLLK